MLEPSNFMTIVIGVAILWLVFALLLPYPRVQLHRNAHPAVEVSATGAALRGYNNKLIARADWADLRAWAVERSGPDAGRQFILVTDDDKLIAWNEPADAELDGMPAATPESRRAAYQECAADLHAQIATRAGLPLRELPTP